MNKSLIFGGGAFGGSIPFRIVSLPFLISGAPRRSGEFCMFPSGARAGILDGLTCPVNCSAVVCGILLTVPVGVLAPDLGGGGTFVAPLSLRLLAAVAGLTILLLFGIG